MKYFLGIFSILFITTLVAQADMEQRPSDSLSPDMIEAKPEGGFSKDISGKWNCGDYGTMILADKRGKVAGSYTYNKGRVTGAVKNGIFKGTWKEGKGNNHGSFEFQISTERMTPKPTNLRGKWKNQGESDWQESPWECAR
ncbi:MAG TPA: hypothetical protein PLY93_04935 [Turneriella sp.]|nr:hypothetical protein [Turneriella sp.]